MDRVVLATTVPGMVDEPLSPWKHDGDPSPCSVEGLGFALGARVWQGGLINNEFVAAARGAGVVIINGNTQMLAAAPTLAGILRGSGTKIALLQESSARVWDAMSASAYDAWIAAARAADVLLLYNDEYAADWEMLTSTPARRLALPMPSDIESAKIPWTQRGHAIRLASAPGYGRGGTLSIVIARATSPTAMVITPTSHHGILQDGDKVDAIYKEHRATAVPWSGRADFGASLARCRLAVNLDPLHTYGRFAADCAALGVPCVGFSSQPAQRTLWPDLTLDARESVAGIVPWLERVLVDRWLSERISRQAAKTLAELYSTEAVRETFWEAVGAREGAA